MEPGIKHPKKHPQNNLTINILKQIIVILYATSPSKDIHSVEPVKLSITTQQENGSITCPL